jgi:hypothetical protein
MPAAIKSEFQIGRVSVRKQGLTPNDGSGARAHSELATTAMPYAAGMFREACM